MIDLVKLRELASAATPGPYSYCTASGGCQCGMVYAGNGDNGEHIFTAEFHREGDDWPKPERDKQAANMAYVSALSPDVVLELLNRLEHEIEHRAILAADMVALSEREPVKTQLAQTVKDMYDDHVSDEIGWAMMGDDL